MNTEAISAQAMSQMRDNRDKKRELAVAAITAKNNLLAEVSRLESHLTDLETKAKAALERDNEEQARRFFDEKGSYEPALNQMKTNLLTATALTERIKAVIREEEEKSGKKRRVPVNEETLRKIMAAFAQYDLCPKEDTKVVASGQNLLMEMQALRVQLDELEREWRKYEVQQDKQSTSRSIGGLARFFIFIARLLGKR